MPLLTCWCSPNKDAIAQTITSVLPKLTPAVDWRVLEYMPGRIVRPEVGEVVVAMGTDPMEELKVGGVAPKNKGVAAQRGSVIPYIVKDANDQPKGVGYWMVSYAPGLINMEADKKGQIIWDLRLAHRYLTTGTLAPPLGVYEYTHTLTHVQEAVRASYEATGRPKQLSIDLETMGLYPWYPQKEIVTVSITHKPGQAEVFNMLDPSWDPGEKAIFIQELGVLLQDERVAVIGANLKFDLLWMRVKWGLICTNFRWDTTIVGSLLDENGSNSLNWHAKEKTGMGGYDDPFNAAHNKGKMEEAIKKDPAGFVVYAGGDTDAAYQVCDHEKAEMAKWPKMRRLYTRVIHPAARAFEEVEYRGMTIDLDRLEALENELINEIDSLEKAMFDLIPRRIKAKYSDNLSLGRSSLIIDYLFTPLGLNLKPMMRTGKTEEPSTAKPHLMMFETHEQAGPFIKLYLEWVKCGKFLGTYVRGFLNDLRPDQRFHPTYLFYSGKMFDSQKDDETSGTVTGRLSAKGPAVQCAVGETMVLTNAGEKRLDWLVSRRGAGLKVLTHTGAWRDIIGVYNNGVQPVFKVATRSGKAIVCTGNHPILTSNGWIRTDKLKVGDGCYITRTFEGRNAQQDICLLGEYESSVFELASEGVRPLRGSGDNGLPRVDGIRQFSERYGCVSARYVDRAQGRERELRTGELLLGVEERPAIEYDQDTFAGVPGSNSLCSRVGADNRPGREFEMASSERLVVRSRDDDAQAAIYAGYDEDEIVSITPQGRRETFDLTIDACHSFVADGLVVHNTIPKHDKKWAPKLRACFVAPPGMVYWSADYSQGELRLTACVAPEPTMLEAYNAGMDLHCVTGSGFANVEYDEFIAYEDSDEEAMRQIFKTYRQRAKSANFGLIYGMQPDGYRAYARAAYGVILTESEAYAAHEGFFNLYTGLRPWHKRYIQMAQQDGYVETPMGRMRHLPLIHSKNWSAKSEAERQAINSPIQGQLSDMNVWAGSILERNYGGETKLWIAGATHDNLYGYCPEDKTDYYMPRIKEVMETLPMRQEFLFDHQIDFPADIELGPSMGECHKWKQAA